MKTVEDGLITSVIVSIYSICSLPAFFAGVVFGVGEAIVNLHRAPTYYKKFNEKAKQVKKETDEMLGEIKNCYWEYDTKARLLTYVGCGAYVTGISYAHSHLEKCLKPGKRFESKSELFDFLGEKKKQLKKRCDYWWEGVNEMGYPIASHKRLIEFKYEPIDLGARLASPVANLLYKMGVGVSTLVGIGGSIIMPEIEPMCFAPAALLVGTNALDCTYVATYGVYRKMYEILKRENRKRDVLSCAHEAYKMLSREIKNIK